MITCDLCGAERAATYELRRFDSGRDTIIIPRADMCSDCAVKAINCLAPVWPGLNKQLKEFTNETR